MPSNNRPQYSYTFTQTTDEVEPSARGNTSSISLFLFVIAGFCIPALVAYGLGTIDELQFLGVVIGVIGVISMLAQPFIGLIFLMALLYIRPEESIPALNGMHFTLLVALVTLVGMIVRMMMEKQQFIRTPVNGMLIGFGVAAVLSVLSSGDMMDAIMSIGRLIIIFLLILNLTRTPAQFSALVTSLLILTAYLALYSTYLYSTGVIVTDTEARSVGSGIFNDPNDLACTFVAAIALTIMRIVQTRGSKRLVYAVLLGIMLYATFLTKSRGGMLALVFVLVAYIITAKLPKSTKTVLAILGLALMMVFAGSRMTDLDTQEGSANSRFWFWTNGYEMLKAHPLTGVGFNNFPGENGGMTAHNSFVLCYSELGLIGYFFFIGSIYYCFRRQPKSDCLSTPPEQQAQDLFASRLGLAAFLAASFWLSHTYSPILWVYVSLPLVATVESRNSPTVMKEWQTQLWTDRKRILAISLGSIFLITVLAFHYR